MANPIASPKLNVLVFAASLRTQSLNRKLATLAARTAEQYGATVDVASMRDFDVPLYDGDVDVANGIPKGAQNFRRRLQASVTRCPFLGMTMIRRMGLAFATISTFWTWHRRIRSRWSD